MARFVPAFPAFLRVILVLMLSTLALATHAQVGNAGAGRSLYMENCAACHGFPPDSDARKAANNPAVLSNAINSVNTMQQILRGLFTQTQINNIAAFIANPNATDSFALTVSRTGSGSGTVTSSPAGISCGSTCSANFSSGGSVTLTAAAGNGSTFAGWSGGVCSGSQTTCLLTMDAAKSVTATFNAAVQNVTLTVSLAGVAAGSVTSNPAGINCGSVCSASFPAGTVVTLTPTIPAGSAFGGWSNSACSGTGNCAITMSASQSVVATFGPINYSDMWWAGQTESGWGMAITQHSTPTAAQPQPSHAQFNAFYVYEGNAAVTPPTWYVMPGGTWSNNFTVYEGALYRPTGSRLDNFVTGNIAVGSSVGTAKLTYTSASTAVLTYTINGVSGTKNILRQVLSGVDITPGLQVGDLWWGGSTQNGWGITLAQQYRTIFGVWYTYGTTCTGANSGCAATWYVMPGGNWGVGAEANTYFGDLYATTAGPWLGAVFDTNKVVATKVGTLKIAFTPDTAGATTGNASNATLTYTFTAGPFAGTTQTKTITRQPF